MLLLLVLVGGIVGGWIGTALVRALPGLAALARSQAVGIPAFMVDLKVCTLQFGFMLKVNAFSILGFFLGYAAYRRL
ncbi:MAG: DUF4321 domain-containing protein [Syntrophomonadaceae bacterium]|jgi:hypothetical protein|nr:DUF4321 domain-containing protein [Syntrophomonadaceae bacterium]